MTRRWTIGQACASARIENYLGFPTGISGMALMARAYNQAHKFGVETAIPSEVIGFDAPDANKPGRSALRLASGERVSARSIVIASGVNYRRLAVENLDTYEGASVHYWASRIEARLCAHQEVVLVGGGNSAGQAAVFLAEHVAKVWMLVRRADIASHVALSGRPGQRTANVEVVPQTEVCALEGVDGNSTLIIDEADDLFYRKSDLRAIVNAGWSRGTRIPRQGRWYDPFCPKILGILGKTKLPRTIASRSIILRMWPKKPDEKAEDFAYADDPEFSTIRRKLARWAADNVRIIKDLKPPQPPGFNNRLSANWKLLLQIAQHAGGGWPEQARRSAIYLSRAPYEPSVGVQLLAALRAMFTKNRTEITSEQAVQELLADPDSPWHEYRGRGPITKNQVAVLLRDYDIRPVVVHPTKRADFSRHGYRAAHFDDAFARFLPHEPNIRTLKRGREGM